VRIFSAPDVSPGKLNASKQQEEASMSRSKSSIALAVLVAAPLAQFGAAAALAGDCEGPPMWHSHEPESNAAKEIFELEVAMIGLWRPGAGPVLAPDLKVAAGSLAGKVNQADQRSIADFERYRLEGEIYYALVYSPAEQAESFSADLDATAFQTAFDASQNAAIDDRKRLVDLETYLLGGQRRYAALFAGAPAAQQLQLQISGADLKSRVEGPAGDLYRHLVDFERVSGSSFAALFDAGASRSAQRFFPLLTADQFHAEIHAQEKQSYRLESVETWQLQGGDTVFAALFGPAPANEAGHLWVQACAPTCQDAVEVDLTGDHLEDAVQDLGSEKASLRLVDIEVPLGLGSSVDNLAEANTSQPRPSRPKVRPRGNRDFELVSGRPPTCHHAGLLHDGGTNGPPFP
jgi:hypothetical protein